MPDGGNGPARPAYASLAYARSLAHVGTAFMVDDWQTPVLLRNIPGAPRRVDAVGAYPVCSLGAGADLRGGLRSLRDAGVVSVVLVADPLSGPGPGLLAQAFPVCRPFKTHALIDRRIGLFAPSRHHRNAIRRARRRVEVSEVRLADPAWGAEWTKLYAGLATRHAISGAADFPVPSFEALAQMPGLHSFAAMARSGEVLGMHLWIDAGDNAYSHLAATSEAGYRAEAAYALHDAAADRLSGSVVLDLGGGAGLGDDPGDGLAAFKRGFSNAAATAWLCGAVLDRALYDHLCVTPDTAFFPAYRAPLGKRKCGVRQSHVINVDSST